MLPRVTSLFDLFNKARTNKLYEQLAIIAARNLGGSIQTLDEAEKWLNMNANDCGSCAGVVEEVNFCRDLVKDESYPQPKANRPVKFKVIKERDVIDSNNYVRWQYTAPRITFSEETQSLNRIQRAAQEQNVAILTAQQQPRNDFLPISDDFVLDDFSLTHQPTDPLAIIQNNPCAEGIIARPESPYRA